MVMSEMKNTVTITVGKDRDSSELPTVTVYDESSPMVEDYGVSSGAEITIEIDDGYIESVD